MEVRDVFALRKEGKAEEAYAAISEIYAVHHGTHTNLCMFLCASDMLKIRLKEKNVKEARRLLGQMVKIYPAVNDGDCRAARAISRGALAMDRLVEGFNLVYFMPWFDKLTDEDWQPYTVNGHCVPSLGQQIVNHLMKNVQDKDVDYINKVMGIFSIAVRKAPYYKQNLRHYAQIHSFLGNSDKAFDTYKSLLRRYHDSYLYAELARLVTDNNQKIALYCQAIIHQPREEFRAKYHLELALLLLKQNLKSRAAYEFSQCVAIRTKFHHPVTPFIQRQLDLIKGVTAVSAADEHVLYSRSKAVVDRIIA